MPKAGGARLRHGLGDFPGNATLKEDFVFWVKALPNRAHHAAVVQRFELGQLCVRSGLVHPLPIPNAGPRLGSSAARSTTDSTTLAALLVRKESSGASPHQK
jgi:hypothetical protein